MLLLYLLVSCTERALILVRHDGVGKGKALMATCCVGGGARKPNAFLQAGRIMHLVFTPIYPKLPFPRVEPAKGLHRSSLRVPQTERSSWLHDTTRHRLGQRPTSPTFPLRLVPREIHHGGLDLRPEIGTMEGALVHHPATNLAVPAQPVQTALGPRLLEHDADGGREADGVMRRVGGQEEHFALADGHVAEDGAVVGAGGVLLDDFEEHAAAVLVEPFGSRVDVVVCAGVGAADDLLKKEWWGLVEGGGKLGVLGFL